MSLPGFEGFEKRLELRFTGDNPFGLGLRRLPLPTLNQILSAVQCTIVSAVSNPYFDSYVLSESSLFIYSNKIIVKTCGTTQLLKSIPLLLLHTPHLGLKLSFCRYSRGSFIFPARQPFPHSCFHDEVAVLEHLLPSHLLHRKACILPSNNTSCCSWHVYSAAASSSGIINGHDDINNNNNNNNKFTVEVCMTDLDRKLAEQFYRNSKSDYYKGLISGEEVGKKMTELAGIDAINPRSLICAFAFDPCGYSMNGLDQHNYSTIHVTPEQGYSYASFESVDDRLDELIGGLAKVVRVFGPPGAVSVSICGGDHNENKEATSMVANVIESMGMKCEISCVVDEFPGTGARKISYQTFSAQDI